MTACPLPIGRIVGCAPQATSDARGSLRVGHRRRRPLLARPSGIRRSMPGERIWTCVHVCACSMLFDRGSNGAWLRK